jgi:adenosine deaminase
VPVTLSTDDQTVSDLRLSEEYARVVSDIGLSVAELWAINRRALDVAFADPMSLAVVGAEFDAFELAVPEVLG